MLALASIVVSLALATPPQPPPPAPAELTTGSATLVLRTSDEWPARSMLALGDSPAEEGDLMYTRDGRGRDAFRVRLCTDDRTAIADLGPADLESLAAIPKDAAFTEEPLAISPGHVYLLRIKDRRKDAMALVRVESLTPGERCTVEWVHARIRPGAGRPLALSPDARARLGSALVAAYVPPPRPPALAAPTARFQVRAGAGGGNPNRVDLIGEHTPYIDAVSPTPIQTTGPIGMHEPSTAYVAGGRIPDGKAFVVTSITYSGSAAGDSNGHGEFIVNVGPTRVVSRRDDPGSITGTWRGRITLRPGDEGRVYVEVANSSAADVTLEGEFVDDTGPAGGGEQR